MRVGACPVFTFPGILHKNDLQRLMCCIQNLNKSILLPIGVSRNAWWVANSEDPDQMLLQQHLIWVYTVCLSMTLPQYYFLLTFSILLAILADDKSRWYFLHFLIKKALAFHANCFLFWDLTLYWEVYPKETINNNLHEMSNPIFWEK